jgi:hypothetical protein
MRTRWRLKNRWRDEEQGNPMHRALSVLVAVAFSWSTASSIRAYEVNPSQAKAVEQIKKLGGTVTVDEKSPDKPVLAVDLHNPPPDLNARTILEKAKQALQYKVVTDAALRDLQGLSTLQSLNLGRTLVSDAGLEHLAGLTQLR